MFTIVERDPHFFVKPWVVLDSRGEERTRERLLEGAVRFVLILLVEAAEFDAVPGPSTFRVALSFPGLIVPGFIHAPAFDNWTRDYGSYHSALDAAADQADLFAGNAIITIVEVQASWVATECIECCAPLRVLERADDDGYFPGHVCSDCRVTPEPNW